MPRFFFDVDEDIDDIGVDLPDQAAARGEAIKAAGEILRDIDGALSERVWRMVVRDASVGTVLELSFLVKRTTPS